MSEVEAYEVEEAPYANHRFAGLVRVAGCVWGVHVLSPTKPGWNEYRIDYADGSSETGVVPDEDVIDRR